MMDWINLFLRWTHLLTGIAWIGSSFYFVWLDSHLVKPETLKPDVEGELWMVHSGGFYLVERKHIGPGSIPKTLHWFKYEALFTWITGFLLLNLIYYFTKGAYLLDPSISDLSFGAGVALGLGSLLGSWVIYDLLWTSPLSDRKPGLLTAICLLLACLMAYVFCHYLSGRAAFIHFGAMMGTIMVANVWMRILPAQQKMIDATKQGRSPDFSLSDKAKRRSIHNSYMTFPVLFMMISNHYGATYGNHWAWVVLILLTILGMAIRHFMIAKDQTGKWAAVPAAISLLALVTLTSQNSSTSGGPVGDSSFRRVRSIVETRCNACHSQEPKIKDYGLVPGGVYFDSPERIHAFAERMKVRAVDTKTMPMQNATGMTDDERAALGKWVEAGAPIEPN